MHNLTYRDLNEGDFDVIHGMASDWNVVRQLGRWPWPADPVHSMKRCKPYGGDGFVWAVCLDGQMCGTVAVTQTELGYCLDPAYAGRGIMTQAADHAVSHAFATRDIGRIDAHVWFDNVASQRVLSKLGFLHWYSGFERAFARNIPTLSRSYRITRTDWVA